MEPTESEWLGLCLHTESDRPEEWRALAAVILNRVASRKFPGTIREVVCQKWQFSFFNGPENGWIEWAGRQDPARFWEAVAWHKKAPLLLVRACWEASAILDSELCGLPEEETGVSPTTLHYWSPRSMKPKGAKPGWAPKAKRLYAVEGIDPARFMFAEGVP